jgi:hypothetical protein
MFVKRTTLLPIVALLINFNSSAQINFNIQLTPIVINGLPGLQSFAVGQYNGNWVIFGGRLDGLHTRQPNTSFPASQNNTNIYVVNPTVNLIWSAPVSSLPVILSEQLQSTNMAFHQSNDKLYIIGGYGYSATINNHKTFDGLVVIDVPNLISAIQNGMSISSHFKYINHSLFAVTGAQLGKIGNQFVLVGGHRFDGRYNPNNGPSFTQAYTNQIRRFRLDESNGNVAISYDQSITDATALHRRDYNMSPQVFPDNRLGYTAFSGVFQTAANLPYLNSVDIDTTTHQLNNTFQQLLNHYHSGKIGVYDSLHNTMHSLFFGGMAQYYYNGSGNLIQDDQVPFVTTIGKVTRNANGSMIENKIGDMPGLLGSGAELVPNLTLPHYDNEVIKLLPSSPDTLNLGYLIGGINSTAPNIFTINTGTQSSASANVYLVKLIKNNTTLPTRYFDFKAKKNNATVILSWIPTVADQTKIFEIEHSKNGITFENIGSKLATNTTAYSFVHTQPVSGYNFYRLKAIDHNNEFYYSQIVKINFGNIPHPLIVYPNPATSRITIELEQTTTGPITLQILDSKGFVISQFIQQSINQIQHINISQLAAGTYMINLFDTKQKWTGKFIKE